MTKFLYIIGLLLLTAMSIKAQQTPKMSAYILRGSITNGDDATAVVGATVRLFQQNKLVGGTVSGDSGNFSVQCSLNGSARFSHFCHRFSGSRYHYTSSSCKTFIYTYVYRQ